MNTYFQDFSTLLHLRTYFKGPRPTCLYSNMDGLKVSRLVCLFINQLITSKGRALCCLPMSGMGFQLFLNVQIFFDKHSTNPRTWCPGRAFLRGWTGMTYTRNFPVVQVQWPLSAMDEFAGYRTISWYSTRCTLWRQNASQTSHPPNKNILQS